MFIDRIAAAGRIVHVGLPQSGMALNDSGDKSKRNTVFFIDPCDAEADRIQSAGHVDGAIQLRFGIDRKDGKEFTQKEVADMMGISQSYISRLEKKIMKRLKKEILRMQQV